MRLLSVQNVCDNVQYQAEVTLGGLLSVQNDYE